MTTAIGREWFMWCVEEAIKRAVSLHGDDGRKVGWTVRCEFDELLGRDYGSFIPVRAAQGIEAATAAETVQQGSVHEGPVGGNADAPKGKSR